MGRLLESTSPLSCFRCGTINLYLSQMLQKENSSKSSAWEKPREMTLSILCCTLRRVTTWLILQCLGTELLCLRSSCMWRGACGSGGKFVPGFWGLELRSVRKIFRESVPQRKKKSSSRQNRLPADWSQGSTSEGGRDLISGRCSGDVVGQPFAETVLKIPCSFKSMNGNKVFLFVFFWFVCF